MKIEHVSFDNINSLGGHFELNLTHPALTDTGLFVITGPTGAGKTTLLDAITYAIYGQTNRQGKLTGSCNEIMTHGTSFCRAEAIVEKDGQRYLFTTEQKRRKNRVPGNDPFSTAERSVSKLGEDQQATLISKSKSAVDKFAASLMKYDNFCRCMMLAQGDFARFLKAAADERSETLATITGTEIYQRIGENVQARVAALKSRIAGVALLPVLDAPAREAAEQRRDEQLQRCKAWQTQLETLNTALAWHHELAKAEAARLTCAQTQQQAANALQQFVQAGQPDRIKAAEAALTVQPQEINSLIADVALGDTETTLREEQLWLEQHPDTDLKAEAEQAAATLAEQQPVLEAQLKFLAETVQPQEEAIAKAGAIAGEAARTTATRAAEAAGTADSATKEAQAAAKAADEQKRALAACARLAADAALAEELPAIRQRLRDWQACPQPSAELPPAATIARRAEAEAAERERLLAGHRREELPLHLNRLESLARLQRERQNALEHSRNLASTQQQAEADLAALPPLKDAEDAYATAHERARLAYQIQDVSGKLDALYREFCAGKLTHCPCCGSPQPHPRSPRPTGELQQAQQEERSALQALEARRRAGTEAQEACAAARAACHAYAQTLDRLNREYTQTLAELGREEPPADLAEQTAQLRAALLRLEELDALAAETQSLQRQDACRSALHEALRPCTPEQPAQLADAAALVRQLTRRLNACTKAAEQRDKATKALALANERATLAENAASRAAAKLAQAQEDEAAAKATLEERRQALAAIWQGDPAAKATQTLHATLNTLQQAAQNSRERLHRLTLERQTHATHAQSAAARLPKLREEQERARADFAKALAEHGFANAAACTAAKLPPETLEDLRRQHTELHRALAAAEGASRQAATLVDDLRRQAVSPESAEELTSRKGELTAVLTEQSELLKTLMAELLKDDDARRDNAVREAELAETRRELAQWQRLFDILGGTKDGFKKYAQRITFNLLLVQANERLRLLTDRYTLVQDATLELGLRVIDRYQDNPAGRSCSNLSGGESFIVSLALALGLAQMAGETRIDTLFLDEGFGTLDEDALEQVLACLQSLRAGGKLIGIISHVDALRERIPANIELLPRAATGLSTIAPHGAVIAQPLCG